MAFDTGSTNLQTFPELMHLLWILVLLEPSLLALHCSGLRSAWTTRSQVEKMTSAVDLSLTRLSATCQATGIKLSKNLRKSESEC